MDEREARLVPDFNVLKKKFVLPILNIEQYDKYKVEHNNKSLLDDSVSFEWDDIKYIIVKNQANKKNINRY